MSLALTNFLLKAIRKSGSMLLRDYLELEHIQHSNASSNFVLKSLERTKKTLQNELGSYPNSNIAFTTTSECKAFSNSCNMSFIVNPIEGLGNLSRALPFFSIVLTSQYNSDNSNNNSLINNCVIYFPVLGEIYYATRGHGARLEQFRRPGLNDNVIKKLKISSPSDRAKLSLTICQQVDLNEFPQDILARVNITNYGSAIFAGCLVAANKTDCFFAKDLDLATKNALNLLISEAGGYVIHPAPPSQHFMVSNNTRIKLSSDK